MSEKKVFPMLQRTMTLAHEPVEPPNYHFTDAEVFAMADAEDRAKAEAEAKAKAGQDALRSIFQGIKHAPATLPHASTGLQQAEADFAMANEEVLRAHKMNGPNVEIHVQSAVTYREDSRRRLAAAEQAYAAARQAEDSTRGGCGCGRCDCLETCGGGDGPTPTD